MGISSAMQTGVAGLQANATAVSKISANIANASTDGYHRSFAQMVTSSVTEGSNSSSSGVQAVTIADVGTSGALRATSAVTNMAVVGNGFFVVSQNPNETSAGNYMLTRAGSFYPDDEGYLVNAAGYYLSGYEYDSAGSVGAVDRNSFSDLSTIQISEATVQGESTSTMSIVGNLPAGDTGLATPGDPYVSSGSFFTALGASSTFEFSWQPTSTDNQWTVTVSDDAGTDYGSVTVAFNDSGANAGSPSAYTGVTNLATAPAAFAFDAATGTATVTLNNGTTPQVVNIGLGAPGSYDGITQFAGSYEPLEVSVDGTGAGSLVRVEVEDNGDLYGIFDNGERRTMYNIPLAEVPNPNGLTATDGNAYFLSVDSGNMTLSGAGTGSAGTIASNSLEGSNVEIAQELTDLIQVQRAYSSNATIITTVDEMLDETMRIKR